MGNDPKTSVVNRNCQVHDIANLFVVDGSVHVTNGGFNPVLTIMAIAYRASEFINANWKPFMRPGKIPGHLWEPTEIAYTSSASRLAHCALIFTGIALPLLVLAGTLLHLEGAKGNGCVTCHKIWQPYSDWHNSAHRNVSCADCHGSVFTLDAGFHVNHMRRVFTHVTGDAPGKPRLKSRDVLLVVSLKDSAAWSTI
jgi:hypothetical protein